MRLDDWLEGISFEFEQSNIHSFVIDHDIQEDDVTIPIVKLKNDAANIHKLKMLLQSHRLPLLTFTKRYGTDDIENLSIDQIDEDEYIIDIENEKLISYIRNKISHHNQKLKSVLLNETVKASIFAILPSVIMVIEKHHDSYFEWNSLVYTSVEDIVEELQADLKYVQIKEEYEEDRRREHFLQQENVNGLVKQWSEYLTENEVFRLCTNKKLRQDFLIKNYEQFIRGYQLRHGIKEINRRFAYTGMSNEMDLIWNKIKTGK